MISQSLLFIVWFIAVGLCTSQHTPLTDDNLFLTAQNHFVTKFPTLDDNYVNINVTSTGHLRSVPPRITKDEEGWIVQVFANVTDPTGIVEDVVDCEGVVVMDVEGNPIAIGVKRFPQVREITLPWECNDFGCA
eukprot:PhF_6_TR6247/c1_g1_i2/m.9450